MVPQRSPAYCKWLKGRWKVCSIGEVEEAEAVLMLVPIFSACLIYAIVFAQSSTFFDKQGATMERSISPGLEIFAASLQSLISLSIVVLIPVYDSFFIPMARAITRKPSGLTMLQRIGTRMFLSALSMVPSELRSVGLSLYLSICGVGNFLSSFLISAIERATGGDSYDCRFANNLNQAHLGLLLLAIGWTKCCPVFQSPTFITGDAQDKSTDSSLVFLQILHKLTMFD
ncbi:unnamed protein product [Dovyalis caffra]|uniref:Uncharacterized protein n=1 Tax=Dovyalis caffra TaxID=77055 RepID=A0AAV1S336_9ROSI|nr:unnamed protein product [Dovyalis caffra]